VRRALAVVALFIASISLVGCGSQAVDENGQVNEPENPIYGKVKKIDVEGTECIIFDADGGGGALSCNWGN
jgi:hypothetical protein